MTGRSIQWECTGFLMQSIKLNRDKFISNTSLTIKKEDVIVLRIFLRFLEVNKITHNPGYNANVATLEGLISGGGIDYSEISGGSRYEKYTIFCKNLPSNSNPKYQIFAHVYTKRGHKERLGVKNGMDGWTVIWVKPGVDCIDGCFPVDYSLIEGVIGAAEESEIMIAKGIDVSKGNLVKAKLTEQGLKEIKISGPNADKVYQDVMKYLAKLDKRMKEYVKGIDRG